MVLHTSIKNRLRLAAALPALFGLLIGLVLALSWQEVREARARAADAESNVQALAEVTELTQEFLLYGGARVRGQLARQQTLLTAALAAQRFGAPEQQALLESIRRGQADLGHAVPSEGPDELGRLATAFNGMTRRLREARTLLEAQPTALDRRGTELEAAVADLESFSYSVSHDLRAPLRAIDGFAAILREDYAPRLDAEGQRLLGVVSDNARRMAQLIDDILTLSRAGRQAMHLTRIDMGALVAEVWRDLEPEHAGRAVELGLADLPPARGDANALRQVWQNLLGNALKFSRGRRPALIEVTGQETAGETRYRITDNGVGFDPAYSGKLFGLFQRLHGMDEFEGTGVGLAIVKRYIDKHGGRVSGEGRPGQGATFHFSLPGGSDDP